MESDAVTTNFTPEREIIERERSQSGETKTDKKLWPTTRLEPVRTFDLKPLISIALLVSR